MRGILLGRWKWLGAAIALCVVGTVAVLGMVMAPVDAKEKAAEAARSVPVKTLLVRSQEGEEVRSFPGQVRASKRVDLSFELPGVLVELPITEGTAVRKGQLLAKIDPRDHQNNLRSAKARFTEARQSFERAQKLLKEKVIPLATFETAQSSLDTAQAQVRILEKAVEDTELRAPFDGTVAKRFVQNYQRISMHEDILSLQNADSIEIAIQVPESLMASAKSKPLQGKLEAVFEAIPGKAFPVRVSEFRVDANNETQTYEVVLTMPAPADYNILPGMSATVFLRSHTLEKDKEATVCWLPEAALAGNAQTQESYVFCVVPLKGTLIKKAVKIGSPTTRGVPVFSGLQDGDVVVVAGSKYLFEGMAVRPLQGGR